MREIKETVVALGLGVAIAAVVACGGSKKAATIGPSAPPVASGGIDARSEIAALDKTIDAEYAKLDAGPRPTVVATNLCPAPPCNTTMAETALRPSDDPTCTHGESQTCKDTCQIADAICGAAISICTIAKELNNDAWAAEKCSSGTASCEKSRGKCCGCV